MRTPLEAIRSFIARPVALAILAAVLAFAWIAPDFAAPGNLANIAKQSAFVGIAAIGITFVLITGGIDLSVGSIMFLASVVAAMSMQALNLPGPAGLAVAALAGAVLGLVNAIAIVGLRIPPFIATLGTLFLYRGLGTWVTNSRQLDLPEASTAFAMTQPLGLPLPVWLFLLAALAAGFVLAHTRAGRQLFAIGHSPDAATKAGIDVPKVTAMAYVVSGACAAAAGFTLIAQIGRLDQSFAQGLELEVIAAAVLGGASVFGGIGTASGAALGAILVQIITAGLIFTNVNLYLQPMITGAVVLFAVMLDRVRLTPPRKRSAP